MIYRNLYYYDNLGDAERINMDDKKDKPNFLVNIDKKEFVNLKKDGLETFELESLLKDDRWLGDNLKTVSELDEFAHSFMDISEKVIKRNEPFEPYITVEFPSKKEEIITIHRPGKKIDDLTAKKPKSPIGEEFGGYEEELDFPNDGYVVTIPSNVHRSGEFPEEYMERVFRRPWEE